MKCRQLKSFKSSRTSCKINIAIFKIVSIIYTLFSPLSMTRGLRVFAMLGMKRKEMLRYAWYDKMGFICHIEWSVQHERNISCIVILSFRTKRNISFSLRYFVTLSMTSSFVILSFRRKRNISFGDLRFFSTLNMTTFFCHIELRLKDLFLALLLKRASINTFLNDQFKLNLIFYI